MLPRCLIVICRRFDELGPSQPLAIHKEQFDHGLSWV